MFFVTSKSTLVIIMYNAILQSNLKQLLSTEAQFVTKLFRRMASMNQKFQRKTVVIRGITYEDNNSLFLSYTEELSKYTFNCD